VEGDRLIGTTRNMIGAISETKNLLKDKTVLTLEGTMQLCRDIDEITFHLHFDNTLALLFQQVEEEVNEMMTDIKNKSINATLECSEITTSMDFDRYTMEHERSIHQAALNEGDNTILADFALASTGASTEKKNDSIDNNVELF
jgi:hypothetical protein